MPTTFRAERLGVRALVEHMQVAPTANALRRSPDSPVIAAENGAVPPFEVNALDESVVHNIGVVCQLARNDALVDALPSPNPGSRIGAELGLSARAVFGR
jgi:hypothetical protein